MYDTAKEIDLKIEKIEEILKNSLLYKRDKNEMENQAKMKITVQVMILRNLKTIKLYLIMTVLN